jgi:hypothetical protein
MAGSLRARRCRCARGATSWRHAALVERCANGDFEIGDEQELETVQLSRGIEPGEQLLLYPPGGTNLAIDPNDEIGEADDENNSVHVPTPREYVCR